MIKNKKILIAPCEISGYYSNLSRGLRAIGVRCEYFTYRDHPFGYGGETKNPFLLRLAKFFDKLIQDLEIFTPLKILCILCREILTAVWAFYAIFKYDVFIFGFGRSLLRKNIDMPILRYLGKIVISNMAHGSEARPPYMDGSYQSESGQQISYLVLNKLTVAKKKLVSFHERYSSVLIGAPFGTSHFANFKFVNSLSLGVPIEITKKQVPNCNLESLVKKKSVRILHAPSNAAVKGTQTITNAINNLKQKGYEIDFILIQGKCYQEVLIEIQKCDFIVDQIYSDAPMPGFATEAAWFGKPAIVGGYGLFKLKELMPEEIWPPSRICQPDEIEKVIEEMIVNVEQREKLGNQAQKFVCEKWCVTEVARRFLRIIEGNIPNQWLLNPDEVIYLEGCGQSSQVTKKNIQQMVARYGLSSLQLSHRPKLESAFLTFAKIS